MSVRVTQPICLALLGPTASGKTDLALAIAQRFPVEIISVDSAQVYRHMDIGTAKPEAWMRSHTPHHLIDIVDPTDTYSAGRFVAQARELTDSIAARGKMPLLVGGTMLYFNALWRGLSALPSADASVRAEIEAAAVHLGWPALHAQLAAIDPLSAQRIGANDSQRIQRALEVYRLTGLSPSTHYAQARSAADLQRFLCFGLMDTDRARLHTRIARRFDDMLAQGLVQELADLRQRFALRPDMSAMRCVGYRQAWEYLDGLISLQALTDKGVAATRQLAKRQVTWMRSMPHLIALDPYAQDLIDGVCRHLERALKSARSQPTTE